MSFSQLAFVAFLAAMVTVLHGCGGGCEIRSGCTVQGLSDNCCSATKAFEACRTNQCADDKSIAAEEACKDASDQKAEQGCAPASVHAHTESLEKEKTSTSSKVPKTQDTQPNEKDTQPTEKEETPTAKGDAVVV